MKTMLSNLAAIAQNTQSDSIRMIDIDDLHESAANFFEVERIEEFAYTILGQGGVKDNLIVRPLESGGYEIISGHRRRAAVQYLLDHGESISRLLPCLIQSYEDEDSMMLDLILMNVSARQLSDQELWQSYEKLNSILQRKKEAGERFGRVRETIAQILGVSPSQVGKLQNVERNAIAPVREAVANGEISISTANVIAQLDEEQQEELAAGDLSEVKPREIKKGGTKKVDTSSNFSDAEIVDTSVNLSEKDTDVSDTDDLTEGQEFDEQSDFTDDDEQEPEEFDDEFDDQRREDAEKITVILKQQHRSTLIGYLTLTLQAMGMNPETISDAQLMMYQVLDTKSDAEARAAYQGA